MSIVTENNFKLLKKEHSKHPPKVKKKDIIKIKNTCLQINVNEIKLCTKIQRPFRVELKNNYMLQSKITWKCRKEKNGQSFTYQRKPKGKIRGKSKNRIKRRIL